MPKIRIFIPVLFLLALTIAMFGQVLFMNPDVVISKPDSDIYYHYLPSRQFGFGELKKGNLALWNPHVFSGMPFVGEFQSALFYPLNLVYVLFPAHRAMNIDIALHIFLTGLFMYLWLAQRSLHPLASLFASVLAMFCGAHFLYAYSGNLTNLCAIAWIPLILLAVDKIFQNNSPGWCLAGIFAVTMQLLAGHPQYFFYTAVAVALYSVLRLFTSGKRTKTAFYLFGIYLGALALGAVQLMAGIEATGGESVRRAGASFAYTSMFSFPPENLITLLVPGFFGDNLTLAYWGRAFIWEMLPFISVTGFILALVGCIYGSRNTRRFSLTMAVLLLFLALGSHTPLFALLYRWIPGFNMFRGNSKFMVVASFFMLMLSGIGMDYLIRNKGTPRIMLALTLFIGVILGLLGLSLRPEPWTHFMQAIAATGESFIPKENYVNPLFIEQARLFAAKHLLIAAGICLFIAVLISIRRYSRGVPYVIALIAMVEIFGFAKSYLFSFNPETNEIKEIRNFSARYPQDDRILYLQNPNSALSLGMQNIWGYDPLAPHRYVEFMNFTQGRPLTSGSQRVVFRRYHPLYTMLRCRYVFYYENNEMLISDFGEVMPRLLLMHNWLVIPGRDDIFAAMRNPGFDPYKTVILEKKPDPLPAASENNGKVTIIDSSTDHLTIEATLSSPAILLITDAYSKGWRVRAFPGSAQKRYEVLPANYILRAIPLAKGYHRFRLEYAPKGFRIGKWISLVSCILFAGLVMRHQKRRSIPPVISS